MYGLIYKAIFPNTKVYIGKTTQSLEERKKQHYKECFKRNKKLPFYNALRKYGWDLVQWEIIDYAENESELNEKEIKWIKELKSFIGEKNSKGYNATIGGDGLTKTKFSLDLIEQILEIHNNFPDYNSKQIKEQIPNCDMSVSYIASIIRGDRLKFLTNMEISKEERQKRMKTSKATLLNEEKVKEIIILFNKGLTAKEIYEKTNYGNIKAINNVLNGTTWSNITKIQKKESRKVKFLSEQDVDNILLLKKDGNSIKEISNKLNIPYNTIANILRGDSWNWYTKIKNKE